MISEPHRGVGIALAFTALIFVVSSIPARAMPQSEGLWRLDKLIHFGEYAVLATLWFRARPKTLNPAVASLLVVLLCGAIGVGDEIYQSTVPGRNSSMWDAFADLLGAAFASASCAMLYCFQRRDGAHHQELRKPTTQHR